MAFELDQTRLISHGALDTQDMPSVSMRLGEFRARTRSGLCLILMHVRVKGSHLCGELLIPMKSRL